jgi:hypothetical protein
MIDSLAFSPHRFSISAKAKGHNQVHRGSIENAARRSSIGVSSPHRNSITNNSNNTNTGVSRSTSFNANVTNNEFEFFVPRSGN